MYDKYAKLMESMIDSNGEINMNYESMLKLMNGNSSWNAWEYDSYEKNTPRAIEQEYHYAKISINGYDELIVNQGIYESSIKPRNTHDGNNITLYSEEEITTEEINDAIEKLYQEYLTDIKDLEIELKEKINSKKKIFKQHLRLKKINRIIEDND